MIDSILWRSLAWPGHEACRLFSQDSQWYLEGTAVFLNEQRSCRLDYQVVCDETWRTRTGKVEGWLGDTTVNIQIKSDSAQHWWMNGIEQSDVIGCIDLDLNFSPSTNLLPIRRLELGVGQAADVRAAWLRFPSFKLELLPQKYSRLSDNSYRYESAGGQFKADLSINRSGFVMDYPGIWQSETISE